MANANGWGDGASNNNIGWGKGADNAIGWGDIHADSWAGLTDIVGAPSTDPDAQAFITAASITNPTQQSAINQLVVDLKGYNIWTKMKALYPFVGGTAAQHKWNLKDPRDLDVAFRLVFNGGWTHSSTGATPNGTNAYADTKYATVTNLNVSSHAFGIYSRTNDTTGTQAYGVFEGAGFDNVIHNWISNGSFVDGASANTLTYTASPTTSLIMLTRRSQSDWQAYRAGVSLGTRTTGCSFLTGKNFYFSARNDGSNTSAQFFNKQQLAFAFLSDGLTNTESGNLYTAVQAFQTTLGRSIGTQTVSDADAQAFVTNAGIVDQVEANAINNLVIGLKADGLWTKMKAVYPFVGGTATTNKFNLKNPLDTDAAFRLVFNGGWTHSSNGATPNGTNAFANTFYNTSTQSTTSNLSAGFYSRTNTTSGGTTFGVTDGSFTGLTLVVKFTDNNTYFAANDSFLTGSGNFVSDTTGLFVINRTSLTEKKMYRNGSVIRTSTPTTNGVKNDVVYLGARRYDGYTVDSYDTRQHSFTFLGDTLTDTDVTNLNTRVTTFQTTLNRL